MSPSTLLTSLWFLIVLVIPAHAETFRYLAPDGSVHYSNVPWNARYQSATSPKGIRLSRHTLDRINSGDPPRYSTAPRSDGLETSVSDTLAATGTDLSPPFSNGTDLSPPRAVTTAASVGNSPLAVDDGFTALLMAVAGLVVLTIAVVGLSFWYGRKTNPMQSPPARTASASHPPDAEPTTTSSSSRLQMNPVENKLHNGFVNYILMLWGVVGLFPWAMVLVRNVWIFTLTGMRAAATGRPNPAMRELSVSAVTYYMRGLCALKESLREGAAINGDSLRGGSLKLAIDSLFSLLFWALTLFAFSASFRAAVVGWISVLLSSNWLSV